MQLGGDVEDNIVEERIKQQQADQCVSVVFSVSSLVILFNRIARKFGWELDLVVWQSVFTTSKLKSAEISYSYTYVCRSCVGLSNLYYPPKFLLWRFGTQQPNLIPANISSYVVCAPYGCMYSSKPKIDPSSTSYHEYCMILAPIIFFQSGTTGHYKSALLTHDNVS